LKNQRSEDEIIQNWQIDLARPTVSIICVTYNHENYIEDAIKGFLIQETDFPFEILIHDDASTDNTAKIIRQYEKQYPKLFRTIYQTKNQYSKGNKPGQILTKMAKGKYIAICEGDDYWTDPTKLQKQGDYLEAHPDVVISFFNTNLYYEDTKQFGKLFLKQEKCKNYTAEELITIPTWLPTSTRVYRNIDFGNIPERNKVLNGDDFLTSILGNYGGAHYQNNIEPTIYRVHSEGLWQGINLQEKLEQHLNTYFWIYKYYKRIGKNKVASFFFKQYENRLLKLMRLVECNSLNKLITYQSFNKLESTISNLQQDKMYLVYGYSAFGRYLKANLKTSFKGFIDLNYKELNLPDIFSLLDLNKLKYDYIIISLLGREEIITNLLLEHGVKKDKITYIDI